MQNREAEIVFAQYGRKLQPLITMEIFEWTKKLCDAGQRFRRSGQHFDQMGSPHHLGYTLLGQVKVDYLHFLSPRTEEVEIIEILRAHDNVWQPVITVSSTDCDPISVESKGDPVEDMAKIKELVLACFDRAGLNFR
jgi:hypothetical protein